jgi:hypothetical protein
MNIKYTKGDATMPLASGPKVILHCCNDEGAWGAGFVLALSKRWKEPEEQYLRWFTGALPIDGARISGPFGLGQIQTVRVEPDIGVCNLIGQHGTGPGVRPPIRYDAVYEGLDLLAKLGMNVENLSIHCPRFGSGLAGGNWNIIEQLIFITLIKADIPITVYDL